MCGLAGWLAPGTFDRPEPSGWKNTIEAMTRTLALRGPDASGSYLNAPVALGHRRLSILDLTESGAQPMRFAENGPTIAYNGEVYNFADLRRELESLGVVFRGGSDTEVVLRTYMHWGLEGLKRLEGIFALAIWDPRIERLVLMRDRLGIKPLYYGETSLGLAFGSQIATVLAAGGCDTAMDDQAFSEYLWYGNSYEDRTFYRGVRQLLPGHWLIVERGQRRIEPWWRIEEWVERDDLPNTFDEAVVAIRDALDASVARQLVADVPVGIFLSGGLDSSSIASSAMHVGAEPLISYAAGFDFDKGVNELPKAAAVAQHLGLDHREILIEGGDVAVTIVELARAHDEPFADAANIPLYLMARQVSSETKVILQGDGGDELFAGYRRYALLESARWWSMVPSWASGLARFAGGKGRRLARIIDNMNNVDPAIRMALLLTVETRDNPPEQFLQKDRRAHLARSTDPFLAYRKAGTRFSGHEPVQQMLLTDLTVQLPSQFLAKVDRSTMAASLEARVPLLDEKVARLAVGMPSRWKVRGNHRKVLLHATQSERLPSSILKGPKTGFGVPYSYWIKSSLHEFTRRHLLDDGFISRFDLDRGALETALRQHRSGERDRGFALWKMLQLSIWSELAR